MEDGCEAAGKAAEISADIRQTCRWMWGVFFDCHGCPFEKEEQKMKLNLGLNNEKLYEGCEIEEVAGRKNLVTPVEEAVNLVGKNIQTIIDAAETRTEVELTGPMAVWAYLVVFHAVVHNFDKVYYNDGRGNRVLVAAHG